MTATVGVSSSSLSATAWEPYFEDGREIGQVHWLLQNEGGPLAGLYRVDTELGAEMPYRVTGTDSFHVIQGEAELETPSGERIRLVTGGIYSFPDGFTATWRTMSPFVKFFVVA